ncbi:CRTAC1 family protein [Muricauda sp. CAU 1633]|uniref:CRTAC1 family protein n=1 Tax=Allomuricauda sp. CAU 1633 TaxID=2816036 RepID=UPI001A8C17DC|nr:CRTAC1 family protein [Muricauda sp. CAU 1633]MBO0320708.1 CRTAC1 family protein [Muricauda sp. CAU 1633]
MHSLIKNRIFKILVLWSVLLVGCINSNKTNDASKVGETSTISVKKDSSTLEMIQDIQQRIAAINIESVPYIFNSQKVSILEKRIQSTRGSEQLNLMFTYGLELLNAGKTEEAIANLNRVLQVVEGNNVKSKTELVYYLKKQLAIAYMRKAEQDNCIANHTNESCIIPISPKAQHVMREGAEQSIVLLIELLAINPNDLECQYLLNIANMTLGQYPEKVPREFRIPESHFSNSGSITHFSDIAMDLGVDVNQLSGGTCVDDFNGDGYLDIIASSWGFNDQIKYFENDGVGGFSNKTNDAGLKGVTGGLNLRHADYDNDGHMDFMILRGAWLSVYGSIPNSLMRNNGDGTFTDVTKAAGLYSLHPTQTAVWTDVNLDGWLDLFIANEWSEAKQSFCELFLNNGDGTFQNIAKEAGITVPGYFKGVASGDINNDLYPDLYLSDYDGPNTLYINTTKETGKPSFKIADESAGVAEPELSFPTWFFDYNNDGFEDIFVSGYSSSEVLPSEMLLRNLKTNTSEYRPLLYQNNGDNTFTEVSLKTNLTEPVATMGCNFGDLDNDGFLDFYLATGDPDFFSIVPNKMYRNVNGKNFEDVTYSGGFGHIQKGHAIGFGDMDMDGDQDIYAVMGGAVEGDVFRNLLFENPMGNENNWINIVLKGKQSNRSAIGAKIIITIEEDGKERNIYNSVDTGASFGGNSLMAEIGLGQAEVIKQLEIKWPHHTKPVSIFNNVEVNQTIQIEEGGEIQKLSLPKFSFKKSMANHQHH